MCKAISNIILFIVNTIVLIIGAILMIVGGLMQWSPNTIQSSILPSIFKLADGGNQPTITMAQIAKITDSYIGVLSNSGLIIFIIGIILAVIAFSGLIGVCCRNRCILIVYIILVTAIFLLIVIFIIVFLVKKNDLQTSISTFLKDTISKEYKFPNQSTFNMTTSGLDISGIIDLIQIQAKCCGSFNGTDFTAVPSNRKTGNNVVPFSCCIMNGTGSVTPLNSSCTSQPNANNSYVDNGCSTALWTFVSLYSNYAAYSLIGLAVILFILIVMAAILARSFDDK